MFKLTPFSASPKKSDEFVDFYNLVDDFFSSPFRSIRHDSFKLDVKEEEKSYIVEADLPGVKREDIKISYQDDILSIAIEQDEKKEDQTETYLHRERRVCSMRRSLNIPGVDPQKIKAKLEDGVLKVTAEKSEVEEHSYVIDIE